MGLGLIAHRTMNADAAMTADAAVMPAYPEVKTRPALNPASLARYVDALPIPKLAQSIGMRPHPHHPSKQVAFYRIEMREFNAKLHRDVKPARQWGFDGISPGPTIMAKSGEPILIEWVNALPEKHFLPIDHHLHGAEKGLPESRTVVHVHGAKVPPESDGYPENWYAPGKSAVAFYPNAQDAAMLWYHDHAMGINRLNIFAGLAGAYLIHDDVEAALNLPQGKYEIPLVISDRMLDHDGQLYYPVSANPAEPWIPEFFGDIIVVNGKAWPYFEVEPRKYRFRLLNAANGRFFRFSLSDGRTFHQIGTDLGLLPAPVELKSVFMAPAERADLIVDFSGHAGKRINLMSESFDVMQFRVASEGAKDMSAMPAALRAVPKTAESDAVQNRMLSLAEIDNRVAEPMTMLLGGKRWMDPITEKPRLNTVEIWNLINLTDDAHPIHLHLVRFQILDRRRFDRFDYQMHGKLRFTADATPPEPNEAGWKDTVRANPGVVTRIIVKFEGYTGRYVWHCHILEHEDNEMMRPYEVVG
ncbi:MAG TPA: multicopper oxidase domain-containing protein [Candidatus Binataceae bacterium]|nr:multicopper oxidase domain-containing protein [Candidatus Binataceae bacterium]